jgi:hypothetical protein
MAIRREAFKNADYIHLLMSDYYENVSAHHGKPVPLGFGMAINPHFRGYHMGIDYAEQLPRTGRINPMRTAVNRVVQAWIEEEELARTATLTAVEQDVATTITTFDYRRTEQ